VYYDYQQIVSRIVRDDDAQIEPGDIDAALAFAATRYSQDRPRTAVEDVTATDPHMLDLPAGWQTGFSELQSIEYPVGHIPPTLIDGWRLYQAPAGQRIMLVDGALSLGQLVRLSYSVPQVLDYGNDTIPASHREPVASYAAAVLLDQLAARWSGDTDSTIQADSVDHGGKASNYASRARRLRQRYYDELGIDPKRNVAAGVVVDWDNPDSRGRDRLTHSGRYR